MYGWEAGGTHPISYLNVFLLLPAPKLRQGNVFTPVCGSVHRRGGLCPGGSLSGEVSVQEVGGLCPGGLCPGESLSGRPPLLPYGYVRAVHILLVCILVEKIYLPFVYAHGGGRARDSDL